MKILGSSLLLLLGVTFLAGSARPVSSSSNSSSQSSAPGESNLPLEAPSVGLTPSPEGAEPSAPPSPAPSDAPAEEPAPPPTRECCKICSAGKACGDSCIRRSSQCHRGPGCACDG